MYTYKTMKKKNMVFFCNIVWPNYSLNSGEQWPKNGSLNYNTVLQLYLFCKREKKWDEMLYVQVFLSLCENKNKQENPKNVVQKEEPQKNRSLLDSSNKEKKSLVKPDTPAASPPTSGGSGAPAPDVSRQERISSQGCQKGQGVTQSQAEQFPSRQLPAGGADTSRQLVPHVSGQGTMPSHTNQVCQRGQGVTQTQVEKYPSRQSPTSGVDINRRSPCPSFKCTPFSMSELLGVKLNMPAYQDDPAKMENLFAFIFAKYNPTWVHIEILLATFLTVEERRMVVEQARAEADKMHAEAPYSLVRTPGYLAVPATDPCWSLRDTEDIHKLEHYRDCILKGLRNGVRKGGFNKVLEVWQKADEDPFSYLHRLLEAYQKHVDIDPKAPEHSKMVNMTFITHASCDIKEKLQKVDGAIGMPTSQLVEIAFQVFINRDQVRQQQEQRRKRQQALVSAQELVQVMRQFGLLQSPPVRPPGPRNSRSEGHMKVKPWQCAYCKQEGHWKKECPSLIRKTERQLQLLSAAVWH